MAQKVSSTTTDHETIRTWVEERGGWPAEVEATAGRDETGILQIDFPGYSGAGTLRRIPWDEWFRKFDDANLAFVYEETAAGGQRSSFNKLVARETAASRAKARRRPRRAATMGRGADPSGARGQARSARAGGAAKKRAAGGKRGATTARKATVKGGGRRGAAGAQAARTAARRAAPKKGGASRGAPGRRSSSRRTSRRSGR